MNTHNKAIIGYVLLGFGIGILMTTSLFYFNPIIRYETLTEDEIKQKASELGMYELHSVIDDCEDKEVNLELNKSIQNKEDKALEEQDSIMDFEIKQGENTEIIIERLFEKGIIEDKDEFLDLVKKQNVEKKFQYGKYKINKGISYNELLNIITVE